MDNFKEKYSEELRYQEIRSNKYTLMGFFWFLIAVAAIWLLTALGFFEVDMRLITVAFASAVVLFIPSLYIYFRKDLSEKWIKFYMMTLICIVSGIMFAALSYHASLVFVVPLLFAILYRRKDILWFTYGVNTVTMAISSFLSFYFGLCDLNILLKSQHVRAWYMDYVVDNALTVPLNTHSMILLILGFEVSPRCIILFVFSIILQYAMVSSNEDALRIVQLTYQKDTDFKTKVFNKNKYEEMANSYYPAMDRIAVIFWDINNLKYINDKYGHAVGDRAIEKLSSALYDFSDDRCRVYRIGGDEFLLIIDEPGEDEAENIIKSAKDKIAAFNLKDDIHISCAAGMAEGKGMDIRSIVKEADGKMYQNKKQEKAGRNYRKP